METFGPADDFEDPRMPLRDLWRQLFGEEAPEFFTEEELMGDLGPRLDRLIGNFLDNTLKDGARGTSASSLETRTRGQ